jgi:ATP-dependent Clp protease ATP-binding subunit ClpC
MLREVSNRLTEREIELEVTERFKEHLVEEGYDPSYGARPLRRAIMRLLEDSLAEAMLSGEISDGDTVAIDVDDEGQVKILQGKQRELALQGAR